MSQVADPVQLIVILALAGIAAGLLAGLFGVGGGLVVVPVVFFVMQGLGVESALAMPIAVSTSLVCILPTALSSTRAHHKLGNVDWSLVKTLTPGLLLGVLLGSQLIAHLRSNAFVIFFGLFLLAVAANIIWRSNRPAYLEQLPAPWVQRSLAALVGAVSAVAGVGGGAMGVPLLTAASVPVHRAIGSCAAFGAGIALVGATSIILTSTTPTGVPTGTWRLVYWPALVALVPLTVVTAPFGAALGKRLPAPLLRRLFAAVLALTSIRMLYAALAES